MNWPLNMVREIRYLNFSGSKRQTTVWFLELREMNIIFSQKSTGVAHNINYGYGVCLYGSTP